MNRPIKFRLRVGNKIVGCEMWHAGTWFYSKDEEKTWISELIFHDDKDTSTGLLDKNGKGIYEGDIVKYSSISPGLYVGETDTPYVDTMVIKYTEKESDGVIGFYVPHSYEEVEIIGNIYENPGLIK